MAGKIGNKIRHVGETAWRGIVRGLGVGAVMGMGLGLLVGIASGALFPAIAAMVFYTVATGTLGAHVGLFVGAVKGLFTRAEPDLSGSAEQVVCGPEHGPHAQTDTPAIAAATSPSVGQLPPEAQGEVDELRELTAELSQLQAANDAQAEATGKPSWRERVAHAIPGGRDR